jgi:hypothetical protein
MLVVVVGIAGFDQFALANVDSVTSNNHGVSSVVSGYESNTSVKTGKHASICLLAL